MKFTYDVKTRERKSQNFDREKITWVRNGKEENIYDFIQSNREDTELYPCLEKYGSIKRMELNTPLVYGQFNKIMDLRDSLEAEKQAVTMWEQLPMQIRAEFNNSRYEFMNNGKQWLENKLAEIEAQKNKVAEGEQNNG